jgi:hypothetical protein
MILLSFRIFAANTRVKHLPCAEVIGSNPIPYFGMVSLKEYPDEF